MDRLSQLKACLFFFVVVFVVSTNEQNFNAVKFMHLFPEALHLL